MINVPELVAASSIPRLVQDSAHHLYEAWRAGPRCTGTAVAEIGVRGGEARVPAGYGQGHGSASGWDGENPTQNDAGPTPPQGCSGCGGRGTAYGPRPKRRPPGGRPKATPR